MLPDRKLSFGSGALAVALRFWNPVAKGERFEAMLAFNGVEERIEPLEVEERERAWQPALRSWPLCFRNEFLSIVTTDTECVNLELGTSRFQSFKSPAARV